MPQFYFVSFLIIGLLLLLGEFAPLQAELDADLGVVGPWVGFGHSCPVDPGPHHECVHGALHAAAFGLAEGSVWHPCATREGKIITSRGYSRSHSVSHPQHHQSFGTDETQCTFGEQFLQNPPLPFAEALHKESVTWLLLHTIKKRERNRAC